MSNKDYIYQRILVFAGKEFDPNVDQEVEQILRDKFNIYLPQRASLNESLASAISDHEIIDLIRQYRTKG